MYTKSSEVNPQKNKHMKMVQTYSLLWDSPRSHKRERLQLLWNLGWEERRKKIWHCLPFSYKPAARCSNQATNSSKKKKHCHFCPDKADAN